ncbi:uncharacterized protein SAPINGB_P002996 [Magnusiomyces paraingens]|uniref:Lysine--tRNA ligase n=1 Tax=Magnusiomyces paraingens TaxID=2606893 RepID=A0A5E8BKN6_9ASCO|nr:uncharacterized protein SAPINGB_P002996 [Saprochaete ingens]VVT51137.1 unnamed protein product [Saprochaete ingens]
MGAVTFARSLVPKSNWARFSYSIGTSFSKQYSTTTTTTTPTHKHSSKSKPRTLTHENEALDFANRKATLLASGADLYPLLKPLPEAPRLRIPEFRAKWTAHAPHIDNPYGVDASAPPPLFTVQGRIRTIRKSGKGLIFMDLIQDQTKLQIVINKTKANLSQETFDDAHASLRRGDIVSCTGTPWKTKSGELSLLADRPAQLLAPCFHPIPTNLTNETTRRHNRVVDLVANKPARDVLIVRATVLAYVREFFAHKGFLEVQTPMLADLASGATATPFVTHSKALSSDGTPRELALRIAPELWLKRLVVSGFDKVFEVGQNFRNEGIDATHNPEFTTCEFYEAYATLDDLVALTQDLLRGVVERIGELHPDVFTERVRELRDAFAADFRAVDFVKEIEAKSGLQLPADLSNVDRLVEFYKSAGIPRPGNLVSAAKLLDGLAGHYLEPQSEGTFEPLLITNHPAAMSPLAKTDLVSGLSRRFELFIDGKEFVNAYEEENSPLAQRHKFAAQQRERAEFEDGEVPLPDESYVEALEWGLPPTGGWGLGVDRLCMLVTGSKRIEEVLAFGGIKAVNYQ